MILTIGYGGKKPTDFFNELREMNPGLVVDVRDYPHKAFLGSYTKTGLEKRLGKKYLWLPVCGNVTRELPPTLRDEESCLKEIRKLMDVHGRSFCSALRRTSSSAIDHTSGKRSRRFLGE